jgi:hypothetical protein
MNRNNVFWGAALILFGVLFLLQRQGFVDNVFELFWPLILILVGGWIVVSVFWKSPAMSDETFSVALGAAKNVRYRFSHGAAQININGNAPAGMALVGSAAVAANHHSHLDGDRLEVRVETGPSFIPVMGPANGVWQYQIAKDVPASISIEAGASTFEIDLRDTLVSRMELKVGASTVDLTLPEHGASSLDIEGGVATFNLRVPEATAARISTKEGFSSINVDRNRFPEVELGIYQSPNFSASADRIDINIRTGMASVTVK